MIEEEHQRLLKSLEAQVSLIDKFVDKVYQKPIDRHHIRQELWDVLYNVQAVAHYMGFTLAECIESSNLSVLGKKL